MMNNNNFTEEQETENKNNNNFTEEEQEGNNNNFTEEQEGNNNNFTKENKEGNNNNFTEEEQERNNNNFTKENKEGNNKETENKNNKEISQETLFNNLYDKLELNIMDFNKYSHMIEEAEEKFNIGENLKIDENELMALYSGYVYEQIADSIDLIINDEIQSEKLEGLLDVTIFGYFAAACKELLSSYKLPTNKEFINCFLSSLAYMDKVFSMDEEDAGRVIGLLIDLQLPLLERFEIKYGEIKDFPYKFIMKYDNRLISKAFMDYINNLANIERMEEEDKGE